MATDDNTGDTAKDTNEEAAPGTDRIDIPDNLFAGLGNVLMVRVAIEKLARVWQGELVSERQHKWRVGQALIALEDVLAKYNKADTLFSSVEVLLDLSPQQARHRMRVVRKEEEIRKKAAEAKKDFDRLNWSEMMAFIRKPNSGKKRGTKATQTANTKEPDKTAGARVEEMNRTGDSLTNDVSPPPNTTPTKRVVASRKLTFRVEVVKQKMAERKVKGSVEGVLALVRDLAGVEVELEGGAE